jgi:hypothetical protein
MIVTIHQPDFLPWLGFFERWATSDLLILLDDAQFLRRGWHHRDRILGANGPAWITVPTRKGPVSQTIDGVIIDPAERGLASMAAKIRAVYAKAPAFAATIDSLTDIFAKAHARLLDLNLDLLAWTAQRLGITTPTVLSSTLSVPGRATQRLVGLVKAVAGDAYLTGTGSKGYLEPEAFAAAGIALVWQDFRHPVYAQPRQPFTPGLSVLDFLMQGADPALLTEASRHAA